VTVCFRDEDNQTTHGCNDIELINASYLAHKEAGYGEIIDIDYTWADSKKYGYAYVRKDLVPVTEFVKAPEIGTYDHDSYFHM
jgi:hypothetical protein